MQGLDSQGRPHSLFHDVDELDGEILGCWCAPNICHGHTLLGLRNEKASMDAEDDVFYLATSELEQIIAAVAIDEEREGGAHIDIIRSDRHDPETVREPVDQDVIGTAAAAEHRCTKQSDGDLSQWRSVHVLKHISRMKFKRYTRPKNNGPAWDKVTRIIRYEVADQNQVQSEMPTIFDKEATDDYRK